MVWPFNKRQNNIQPQDDSPAKKQPIFLEDIPPKFPGDLSLNPRDDESSLSQPIATAAANHQQQQQQQQPKSLSQSQQIRSFITSLSPSDFHISKLTEIPCFREAGLTGLSTFFVFFSVILLYHKNTKKAANWGFGGLILGSIFAWEQCGNQRRQSQMSVAIAQERFKQRQLEKMREEERQNGGK